MNIYISKYIYIYIYKESSDVPLGTGSQRGALCPGAPVEDAALPESLRYVRRRQGALSWRSSPAQSNRTFWKKLRYHMPPVPLGRLQTSV